MKYASPLSVLLCLLLPPLPALTQSWTGNLEKGGVVSVDPSTNKAKVYSDNGSVQLWDGTHRLQDGSVIIVNDGVVTSRTSQREIQAPEPVMEETSGIRADSVCVSLAIKVCGFNGECNDNPACSPARQLMKLERDEATQTGGSGTQTSSQCREALANEAFFSRCRKKHVSSTPTPCQQLAARVCGADGQCTDSPACSPAQQLLTMENREREASRDPERATYTSRKCSEALAGSDFFTSCPLQGMAAGGSDSGTPESENQPAPIRLPGRFRQ